jgi:hypothetical protein
MPPWVFCSESGGLLDEVNVRRAFRRVLKTAGLPHHFWPHCLRHSYASLLLQQGEGPEYVKRQLGHASIELTVDTYGKWLPRGNKAAVDRLDDHEDGSKVVANGGGSPNGAAHVPKIIEATRRNRTGALPITNPQVTRPPRNAACSLQGSLKSRRPSAGTPMGLPPCPCRHAR